MPEDEVVHRALKFQKIGHPAGHWGRAAQLPRPRRCPGPAHFGNPTPGIRGREGWSSGGEQLLRKASLGCTLAWGKRVSIGGVSLPLYPQGQHALSHVPPADS